MSAAIGKSTIPKDFTAAHSGLHYKVGRFGKVYYWNEDWIRSELDVDELNEILAKKEARTKRSICKKD